MKTRLLGVLVGMAISFALPTYAQQKDLADPQTTQKIHAIIKALVEGYNNHDAAAIAALYTRDAVLVTDSGSIIGRQAIQKWNTDLYQWWHPENHIDKVDGNAFHLIGTAGTELWATGEWSETGQGKNGEPISIKGYWAGFMFVRAMIGRSGWVSGTLPRTVSYSSTRVLHHNRPQHRPRPPALTTDKLATNFSTTSHLRTSGGLSFCHRRHGCYWRL